MSIIKLISPTPDYAFSRYHIVPAIALFNWLEDKLSLKKYFGPRVLFVVAAGALLPDIDIPLNWFLKTLGFGIKHGIYTHTLFFAFLFVAPGLILFLAKHYRPSAYLAILGGGIVLHLFLDYLIGGGGENGVMWFFHLSDQSYKIHLLFLIPLKNLPEALDAAVFLGWIYFKSPILLKTDNTIRDAKTKDQNGGLK